MSAVGFAAKKEMRALLRETGVSPESIIERQEREMRALLAERTAAIAAILAERDARVGAVVDGFIARAEAIDVTSTLERGAAHLESDLAAVRREEASLHEDVRDSKALLEESRRILSSLQDVLAELKKKAKSPPEKPYLQTLRCFGEKGSHWAANQGKK